MTEGYLEEKRSKSSYLNHLLTNPALREGKLLNVARLIQITHLYFKILQMFHVLPVFQVTDLLQRPGSEFLLSSGEKVDPNNGPLLKVDVHIER